MAMRRSGEKLGGERDGEEQNMATEALVAKKSEDDEPARRPPPHFCLVLLLIIRSLGFLSFELASPSGSQVW